MKNQTIKHTLLKSDNEKKFLDTRPNSLQPHCELTRGYIWFLADLYFPKYKSNVFRTEMHKGIPILEKKETIFANKCSISQAGYEDQSGNPLTSSRIICFKVALLVDTQ